ncbi:MAG: lysylphosphatidylglycerol synthase transmembrane domain-containing protein [Dehalococcoidia bacterium]|nr:lysylphosphatidylglycerol synthase transmembrane domain-containing protein [Dehalococcoidia bacterium]
MSKDHKESLNPIHLIVQHRLPLQFLISAVFIGILIWRVDIRQTIETFGAVNYGWVLPALIVFSLSKLLHSIRWQMLLKATERAPVAELFGIYLVSNMTNNAIPFRAGDVLRIQVPAERFGIPRAELTSSVIVVETVFDAFTFFVLLLAVLTFLGLPAVPAQLVLGLSLGALTAFIGLLLIARIRPPRHLAESRWTRIFSDNARRRIAEIVPQLLEGLQAMREMPRLGRVLAISFPAWLVEALMFWLLGLAFGLGLQPHEYIVVMIGANLIVSLPITPWNLGTYEFVVQEVAAGLGANRSVAAAYAFGTHIFTIIWITITGLLAVWFLNLSLRDIMSLGRKEMRGGEEMKGSAVEGPAEEGEDEEGPQRWPGMG